MVEVEDLVVVDLMLQVLLVQVFQVKVTMVVLVHLMLVPVMQLREAVVALGAQELILQIKTQEVMVERGYLTL